MPATSIYALPYPAASDPADIPLDMQELADRIETVLGVAPAATFPGSPTNGQIAYLQAATGVIWQFRYNSGSASAYKWEFTGGPPLISPELASSGAFSSTTYIGTNPTLTLPRPGDYLIDHGCSFDAGAAATFMAMSYSIGATTAVDADWVEYQPSTGGGRSFGFRRKRKDGLTAVALVGKFRNAGTSEFKNCYISAIPIRCS